jgi:hypothetical protein
MLRTARQTAWFVLDTAGLACTGIVDGSRQDSGPMTAGRLAEEGVM